MAAPKAEVAVSYSIASKCLRAVIVGGTYGLITDHLVPRNDRTDCLSNDMIGAEIMIKLIALFTTMVVAALTPGPNNFIILGVSSRCGLGGAAAPIAGVVSGSLAMLLAVWSGASFFAAGLPQARLALGALGCGYLCWLGLMLIWKAGVTGEGASAKLPTDALSIALFQPLNPKAWMFITAVTGAGLAEADDLLSLPLLAAMMVFVTISGLTFWALAGAYLTPWLASTAGRRRFDRLMGLMLLISAPLLLL